MSVWNIVLEKIGNFVNIQAFIEKNEQVPFARFSMFFTYSTRGRSSSVISRVIRNHLQGRTVAAI